MKGYFDEAVNNNEISAYFKGKGDYFTPEELYKASHSYIMNFMGMMFYLEKRVNPYQELVKYGMSTLFHTTKLRGNCLLNAIGVK